nr:hypothetical protein [Parenemella sanctibonifatiensis]
MTGVDAVLVFDLGDAADRALLDHLHQAQVLRGVAQVVGNAHPYPIGLRRLEQSTTVGRRGGDRLLDDHLDAGLDRGQRVLQVGVVGGGDDEAVAVGQHLVELVRPVRRQVCLDCGGDSLGAYEVLVDQCGDLGNVAIVLATGSVAQGGVLLSVDAQQRQQEAADPAVGGPTQCVPDHLCS